MNSDPTVLEVHQPLGVAKPELLPTDLVKMQKKFWHKFEKKFLAFQRHLEEHWRIQNCWKNTTLEDHWNQINLQC